MECLEWGITLFLKKKKKKEKKKEKWKKSMRLTSVFSKSSRKPMSIIICHDYYSLI